MTVEAYPLKPLCTEFKQLTDYDTYRGQQVVKVSNVFYRCYRFLADWWHGGKAACDQREFRELCDRRGNENGLTLKEHIRSLKDRVEHFHYASPASDVELTDLANQAKWLLKIKSHLLISGIADHALQGDTSSLFEETFGSTLTDISRQLEEYIEANEGVISPGKLSTIHRAQKWIEAADDTERLKVGGFVGQVPLRIEQIEPGSILLTDMDIPSQVSSLFNQTFSSFSRAIWVVVRFFFGHSFFQSSIRTSDHNVLGIHTDPNSSLTYRCQETQIDGVVYDRIVMQPLPSYRQLAANEVVPYLQNSAENESSGIFTQMWKYLNLSSPTTRNENGDVVIDSVSSHSSSEYIAAGWAHHHVELVEGIDPARLHPDQFLQSKVLQPIFISNPILRQSLKHDPLHLESRILTLSAEGVLTPFENAKLNALTGNKREFREFSVGILERLLRSDFVPRARRDDFFALLENNQFYEFYDFLVESSLHGRAASDHQHQKLKEWVQSLPTPSAQLAQILQEVQNAIDWNMPHNVQSNLLRYFELLRNQTFHYHNRNEIYAVIAWLYQIKSMDGRNFTKTLEQSIEDVRFFEICDEKLQRIALAVKEQNHVSTIELARELGIEDPFATPEELLDAINVLYVNFLKIYSERNGEDWIYYFYYGNFVDSFKKISSSLQQHRWCGECHFSADNHPENGVWPNTLHEDSPFAGPDRIVSHIEASDVHRPLDGSVSVFTCSFGTGHNTAAAAVAGYLSEYNLHVDIADPSEDVLLPASFIHSAGRVLGYRDWSDAKVFKWVIRNQLYWLDTLSKGVMRIVYRIFGWEGTHGVFPAFTEEFSPVKALVYRRLMIDRPDVLASTYHMDLNLLREVGRTLKIPYVHLPTDTGVKAFETNYWGSPDPEDRFVVSIPYNDDRVLNSAHEIDPANQFLGGYPVRPAFLEIHPDEDLDEFKQLQGIDLDATLVTVMTGGGGIQVPYPEMLANDSRIQEKMHVVVVAGNNRSIVDNLRGRLTQTEDGFFHGSNPNVTIQVATERRPGMSPTYLLGPNTLAFLQQASDVVLTKPGGASTAEILYSRTQMVFDQTVAPFSWEQDNASRIHEWGQGESFYRMDELTPTILRAAAKATNPELDQILINPQKAITGKILDLLEFSKGQFGQTTIV